MTVTHVNIEMMIVGYWWVIASLILISQKKLSIVNHLLVQYNAKIVS